MSLKETLTQDMKTAMKNKEKETLATIRLLTAAIKNEEIKVQKELTEERIMELIQKEVKQTQESLESYQKATGDYQEKIQELKNRTELLKNYLPKPLTEEELKVIIQEAIKEAGATSKNEMGKVMAIVMPKVKGKADGSIINKTVGQLLS